MSDIEELWAGPTGKWDKELRAVYQYIKARYEQRQLSRGKGDSAISGDRDDDARYLRLPESDAELNLQFYEVADDETRLKQIKTRCNRRLHELGFSAAEFDDAIANTSRLIQADSCPEFCSSDSDHYYRQIRPTYWFRPSNHPNSLINRPFTRELLQWISGRIGLSNKNYWWSGYTLAYAISEIVEQTQRRISAEAEQVSYLPDGIDRMDIAGGAEAELAEVIYFVEGMIGRAEEALLRAEGIYEFWKHGRVGATQKERTWEDRVVSEIRSRGGNTYLNKFRTKTGKCPGRVKYSSLANSLFAYICSNEPPWNFPKNPKTVERRLPGLLDRCKF